MARDYYDRDRNMWERGRDEVRSWFGDEEAERRRRLDAHWDDDDDWGEGRRFRGRGPYSYDAANDPAGRPDFGRSHGRSRPGRGRMADAEFERDWDLDYRTRTDYEPYRAEPPAAPRPAGRPDGWHERDARSMYGGSHGGRRAGRYYDDDWDLADRRQRTQAHGGGRYSADPQGSFRYYSDYYNDEQGREDHSGRGPSGYRRSDERIREDLNESLTWDRAVDASHIDVKVADGVVTLSGTVGNRRMKRRAEDLADSVRGVDDVHNQLRVSRGGDASSTQDLQQRGRGQTTAADAQSQQQGLGSGRSEGAEPGGQDRKFRS